MIQSRPTYDNDHQYYYYHCNKQKDLIAELNDKCKQHPCMSWYNFPSSIQSPLLFISELLPMGLINQPITSLKTALEWIDQCQIIFKNSNTAVSQQEKFSLAEKYTLTGNLLNQCLLTMNYISGESNSRLQSLEKANNDEINRFTLSKMDEIAIDWTIRYGLRNGSLPPTTNTKELIIYTEQYEFYSKQFHTLLCTIRLAFEKEKQQLPNNHQKYFQDEPFDWFVATIFLLYQGNYEHAWNFLCKYSSFSHSLYLWPNRCRNLVSCY
ncbi:unnamed protein product [Schistosoma turkestanicum]|nr:unnamed protein product [Schistosoma turkestanicum]